MSIDNPLHLAGEPREDRTLVAVMDELEATDVNRLLRVFVRRKGEGALSELLYAELEEEAKQDPEGMAALLGMRVRGEEA